MALTIWPILTSVKGRRLGLQRLTTAQSGGTRGNHEFLVGPDDFRVGNSTASTTSTNLKPFGVHLLAASSVGSSQVYTLDPPIPGVRVTIHNSTDATAYIKMQGAETIKSSVGSTQTVIALPAAGHSIELTAVTSALWVTRAATASGINLTNST